MRPFARSVLWATWWALVGAFCFLAAIVFANIVKGGTPPPTGDQWESFIPPPQFPADDVWMPAFKKWLEERKPPVWEIPCVCSCADTSTWDKCCVGTYGPVAQSGEPPPCKRQTPGRNRSGPPTH